MNEESCKMALVREDMSGQVDSTKLVEEDVNKYSWERRREQRRRLLELLEKEWRVHGG